MGKSFFNIDLSIIFHDFLTNNSNYFSSTFIRKILFFPFFLVCFLLFIVEMFVCVIYCFLKMIYEWLIELPSGTVFFIMGIAFIWLWCIILILAIFIFVTNKTCSIVSYLYTS